ncbi:MAG: hypothetical protein ABJF11_18290 [Reichenbachiella sp.]|uniref:hypothetical protein n=1 Tax=Reichenbachiella sp. TaxID=2184521 RepID=UPI0032669E0E
MTKTFFWLNRKSLVLVAGCLVAMATLWACEEEQEPVARDPSVGIFFLNKDSLDQVSVIIDSLDTELEEFDELISSLEESANDLADSLITLTDLIADGSDLTEERDQVIHDLDTLNVYIDEKESEDSTISVRQSEWTSVSTVINSGEVLVTSIENNKNGQSVMYEDSSVSWNLPLDMQSNDVDVNIALGNEVYRLVVRYELSTLADEKNKVIIRTSDFEIEDTNFDNVSLSCSDCDDTETTIYVEF